ncbi:MAG TPA: hypothetical protein VEC94_10775 [Pseudolabrys sp.]|nr:hypothetical protein [Pseudolabrys sp.]
MAATTYQTRPSLQIDGRATLARFAAHIGELIEGAREGRRIEARYFELSRLSGADLARRGLHRPYTLAELISQPAGRAVTDRQ